jgi:hypothetical protein
MIRSNHGEILAILIALACGLSIPAGAQPAGQSGGNAALRQQIERRFDVVPLRSGLALVPKPSTSTPGRVKSIELTDGNVAIDGLPATGGVVRAGAASCSACPGCNLDDTPTAGPADAAGTATPAGKHSSQRPRPHRRQRGCRRG